MTLLEASKRFGIDGDTLLYYEKNGLLDCHRQPDGSIRYCEEMSEYLSLIGLLLRAGLDMEALKAYLGVPGNDRVPDETRRRILMKQRYALLDDIHDKEKILNRLDYIIHESKKKA